MSNFRFLVEEWPALAQEAMEAERFALSAPIASAVFARRALEKSVHWLQGGVRMVLGHDWLEEKQHYR